MKNLLKDLNPDKPPPIRAGASGMVLGSIVAGRSVKLSFA